MLLLVASRSFYFSRLGTSETYWELLPGLVAMGVGMALTMTPTTAAAMGGVPRRQGRRRLRRAEHMRQVGGSLGIAVIGAIVAHVSSSSLAAGHTRPEAFMDGFQRGLEVAAAIAAAGSVVAVVTMRGHRQQLQTSTEEPAFQEAA